METTTEAAFSDDFEGLTTEQKAELFDAMMSLMTMGSIIENEYAFLVYRCGGHLNFDIDSPAKLLAVAARVRTPGWYIGKDDEGDKPFLA